MDIILYLLSIIQHLYQQNCWLINFICRYIPLKQWAYEDSHSPKYQKFKVDELPHIKTFIKQDWQFLLEYYLWRYGKPRQACAKTKRQVHPGRYRLSSLRCPTSFHLR